MHKTERIEIKLEPELKNQAYKAALKTGKTLSELIRDYLRELIKQQKVK